MPNVPSVIGLSKSQIVAMLTVQYVEFAHWLYLPALSLLLCFDKQHCVGINQI